MSASVLKYNTQESHKRLSVEKETIRNLYK